MTQQKEQRNARIIQERLGGCKFQEIAERWDLSRQRVHKICQRVEVYPTVTHSQKLRHRIVCLRKQGLSRQEIAKVLKISPQRVSAISKELKLPSFRRQVPLEDIYRNYCDGVSINALAKEHQMTRNSLWRRLVNAGYTLRSRKEAQQLRRRIEKEVKQ